MDFSTYFPVWNKLTPVQQDTISTSAVFRTIAQGTVITGDGTDCTGLLLLKRKAGKLQFTAFLNGTYAFFLLPAY